MIKIGAIIDDRYEILKEIGRGGMSIVYLAMDNRLNKSLVVKDIRKRANSDNEFLVNSLVIEANMLKKLDHGALPRIYDIIESEGDIYVVMDYIEGESLKEKHSRDGNLPADLVIDWAKQLADVLGYLHTRRPFPIIYRDMKPDNIMLTPEGKIKLIDFGIAKEYKTESLTDTTNLGTISYAAPEQLSGKKTDARSDIYSLGLTLYNLVTGKGVNEPPFTVKPIRDWNPSLPEGLEHIITKCTESEPENRYQSCDELYYDLENIDTLTKGYKKKLLKKLYMFLVPAVLFILFSVTTAWGYSGMKNEQFQDYMKLVNQSNRYLINGKDAKAIELLEQAITSVDSKKPEAYINLLDIYIKRGEIDNGLASIEAYIQDKYGNVHKNNEVLFKMGMTYFDLKNDYVSALKYFRMVDEEELPDAKYYKSLATTMGSLNVDYQKFANHLQEFETYNDSLANNQKKIDNYNSLAGIYLSYKGQIPDANTKAITVIQKANLVLKKLDDEHLQYKYELDFDQKLAQAFYSRAINSEDKTVASKDFAEAIEHYQNLIDQDVSDSDKEEAMVKIGVIFQEMGENGQAVEQLRLAQKKYPESIEAHIKLGNLLLDIEQGKEEGQRNYSEAKSVFDKVSQIDDAVDDESYKKFTRRLQLVGAI
ncbi:protein kinase domain-containing protein [Neobacillus sp. LXY-4]|uniref:protein kinase domain-containing protein n=1 Tax=Neobacillus sp. LXY-4 TaxID=3379826 RepID=UPI003EE22E70